MARRIKTESEPTEWLDFFSLLSSGLCRCVMMRHHVQALVAPSMGCTFDPLSPLPALLLKVHATNLAHPKVNSRKWRMVVSRARCKGLL